MVGFHITDYCLNFIDCCQRNLGCRVDRKNLLVELGGRTIIVRPLPIGVPFDRFVQLAKNAKPVLSASSLKIILGVDRLDYTKGLVHKLKAFERLLQKHPEHIEKVVLLQISVPSRTDVKEYQDLKEEMDQLVGRINGSFTTPNWSPIRSVLIPNKCCYFYVPTYFGMFPINVEILQIYLRMRKPKRASSILQRCSGGPSNTFERWDEPSSQGVCGVSDKQATWSADYLTIRWSWRDDARGTYLQSLRSR